MEEQSLIAIINSEMDLALPLHMAFEEMRQKLQARVNQIIETDFQKLVNILYRIDVNERKLKYLLQENVGEDAPVIIADLIIERQMEKIKSRKQFSRHDDDSGDEEKW
ncbi:MAG TPA: hypothetical protein VK645_03850 [Chitinophagaceae bacterium]|nr:hypothetical protein [Chitinophagaceae bacterium]